MKKQHVETLEEMVFKNRNKSYGAYFLRNKYRKHVTISLFITLFFLCSALSYPLISSYLNKGKTWATGGPQGWEPIPPPVTDQPPPPPPPPPPPAPDPERAKFTAPKIVESDSTDDNFGRQDILAQQASSQIQPDDGQVVPTDNPPPQTIETPRLEPPIAIVQIMPQFPGGDQEMYKYLRDHLHYPEDAKSMGISGVVYLTFVVEKNGSISNLSVLRGIGGGCDEEASRVVSSMPQWNPGKQNGMAVRVQFNLPIKFTLQ